MPAFSLKTYQSTALDALTVFLRNASTMGLEAAWAYAMRRDNGGNAERVSIPYRSDELGEVPCVCLRIPTGGGKTLMASHAIARIGQTWAQRDYPVALWLVPSDAIRSQTLSRCKRQGTPTAQRCKMHMVSAFRCVSWTHCTPLRRKAMDSRRLLWWRRFKVFASLRRMRDRFMP